MPGDHDDDAAEPTPVSPEDWRETERWLEEWTRPTDRRRSARGRPGTRVIGVDSPPAPPAAGGTDAPPDPSDGNPPPDAPAFEAAALDPLTAQAPAQGPALPPGFAPPASPAYAAGGKAAPPPHPASGTSPTAAGCRPFRFRRRPTRTCAPSR